MKQLIGGLVVILDIAQFMPQAFRAAALYRQQHSLRGLSQWTWSVATVQAVLWVIYGLRTHREPIALPNLLIAPICLLILVLVVLQRRSDAVGASAVDRPTTLQMCGRNDRDAT